MKNIFLKILINLTAMFFIGIGYAAQRPVVFDPGSEAQHRNPSPEFSKCGALQLKFDEALGRIFPDQQQQQQQQAQQHQDYIIDGRDFYELIHAYELAYTDGIFTGLLAKHAQNPNVIFSNIENGVESPMDITIHQAILFKMIQTICCAVINYSSLHQDAKNFFTQQNNQNSSRFLDKLREKTPDDFVNSTNPNTRDQYWNAFKDDIVRGIQQNQNGLQHRMIPIGVPHDLRIMIEANYVKNLVIQKIIQTGCAATPFLFGLWCADKELLMQDLIIVSSVLGFGAYKLSGRLFNWLARKFGFQR